MNLRSRKLRAGVVDYDMGNLRSVAKSLEAVGVTATVSDDPRRLAGNDLLVVPGVGSFDAAMQALRRKILDRFIVRWIRAGKPYIGLCLGLQLLFDRSEEAPGETGLKVLRGTVRRFRPVSRSQKIPHMGWNRPQGRLNGKSLNKDYFYFVHSYYPAPRDKSIVNTRTPYGISFCSSVRTKNIYATQFHPEKSGEAGLRLLKSMITGLLPC
ncbi:MAG TPA: imidazole glycerol phosphate synthase subunit HisH [Elusimicrobiota bacterium]|nr:imidazole glycerol phosphate synthase subunit HisH [Elusimicrobiota bacterium]